MGETIDGGVPHRGTTHNYKSHTESDYHLYIVCSSSERPMIDVRCSKAKGKGESSYVYPKKPLRRYNFK